MNPPECEIFHLSQFVGFVDRYWSKLGWICRGQANRSWPLMPKAGRPEYYLSATSHWRQQQQSSSDLGRFKAWREQAVGFCNTLPENDFECLAYAQHYGMATRLLDWSDNPLAALFFAVEDQHEVEGGVFFHWPKLWIDTDIMSLVKVPVAAAYRPRPIDRRVLAQGGVFTYHPDPEQSLQAEALQLDLDDEQAKAAFPDGVDLVIARIPAKAKPYLQRQLSAVGISRKSLFPDLEGLSSYINWDTRRSVEGAVQED